jgi:hypothetical protein
MRRWLVIILLIVYPFQVVLALADECCVTTPGGVTHHGVAEQGSSTFTAAPALIDDAAVSALADPHCPECNFGHQLYLPSVPIAITVGHQNTPRMASDIPFPASLPMVRLERPKWSFRAR